MKKIAFLGLCLAATVAASAQISVVKEAERQAKDKKYEEAMKTIQPAFADPETSALAYTYFVPGKAGIDLYTDLYLQMTIGKQADKKKMGHALIDGYGYLLKALPLDSVPDAKGKVKPKYSKNIIKMINENYNSLNNAAVAMWEAQDFQGAYDAWQMLLELPKNPVLGKNAPKAYADSTNSDIYFNQALAAWQIENIELSLASLEKAIASGYNKAQAYDYAISHAARLGQNDKVYKLAEDAYAKYGNANPLYLQLKINGLIENQKYEEAASFLENAIAANPEDGQLYNIQGILYESMKNEAKAKDSYLAATEKDPKNANALYNYARMICNEAYRANDKAQEENTGNDDYQKIRIEVVNPLFVKAAGYLERALELDPENHDVKTILRNIYYNVGDEENLKRIESL